MKHLSMILALGGALAAFADPEASKVVLTAPVNGVATITYELTDGPAVITLDIEKKVGNEWQSIGEDRLWRLSGDVNRKVTGDSGTIKWSVDGAIDAASYRAKVTAWPMDDTPDYMVVSLAKSQNAEDRIRYYTSTNALPGGLLANIAYRTTMMVFKKVVAKDVAWKMGCTHAEPTWNIYEAREKQHDAKLDRNYYLAVFPATQAQCALIRGSVIDENHTIERMMRIQARINYENYIRYTNWPDKPHSGTLLGQARALTDQLVDFDLPTEAEWEFACRAGHGDGYWGDGSPMTMVTYTQPHQCENLAKIGRYRYNQKTNAEANAYNANLDPDDCTPIAGSYKPNDWGFYDMNGGVDEFCLDWYQEDITGLNGAINVNKDDSSKCADGTAGSTKVIRGGNWSASAYQVRPATRLHVLPTYYGDKQTLGFRPKAYMGLK